MHAAVQGLDALGMRDGGGEHGGEIVRHLPAADRHDDLARTVDYARLQQAIAEALAATAFRLIESVAERIAAIALDDTRVAAVTVCVGKPGALPGARTVEVEITRSRENGLT